MSVASTPPEVERTRLRRVMRASVAEVKSVGAENGSWVALSDAIVTCKSCKKCVRKMMLKVEVKEVEVIF